MNATPLNIISPKSLEKQLKVVEARIGVLQSEISELQKIKDACLVLLGTTPQEESLEAAPLSVPGKGKKKKSEADSEEDFSAEPADEAGAEEEARVN